MIILITPRYLITLKPQNLAILFICICSFFGIGTTQSIAQKKTKSETLTIEATVLDKDTKDPLPFTNVIVENTSIGTITNEDGMFELTISKKYESSSVIFSFVGYENTSITVKKITGANKKVYLQTASTSLDEIIVTAKNKYKELIDQAIALIPKNYAQNPVKLETYYRELTKTDTNYTKFSDAASTIYYTGYDPDFDHQISNTDYIQFNRLEKNINQVPFPEPEEFIADTRDQAKIVALRKSNNLKDYKILEQSKKLIAIDTSNLKWLENNDIGGGPLRLTGADKIKRLEDFLDPKINNNYLFTLYGKSSYDDRPIYIISFKPKDSTSLKAKYLGEITIDEENKAIIGYQYRLTKKAKKRLNRRFAAQLKTPKSIEKKTKKAFITRVTSLKDYKVYVSFSKYQDKWYLKRIKAINEYTNSGDLFEDYKVITESELVVNSVKTDSIHRLSPDEIYKANFSNFLFNYHMPYDIDFWKKYSTLLPIGVVGKALEDLETKGSLESQFLGKQ